MSSNSTQSLSVSVPNSWSGLPKDAVSAALEKILEAPQFRSSKKCTRFLRHVIAAALDNHLDCLKERTLGVDVFEREPHYDTNQDPIVRGTAGEVRKRLAQYYQESGSDDEYRITLPAGSYVPEIHRVPLLTPAKLDERTAPLSVTVIPAAARSNSWRLFAIATALTALGIAALASLGLRRSPLDRFWSPLLDSGQIPLVCMGQPQLYTFRSGTAATLNSWFARNRDSAATPSPVTSVPTSEIIPMWGESVAAADAQSYSRIANLFARKRKQLELRGERSVSLSDLRRRPSIFIGAFDNAWTLDLASELRFYFEAVPASHDQVIRDRRNPSQSAWRVADPWPPTEAIHTDYALVTRVLNRTTEQTIVTVGGISEYGTAAAAEFVTNPDYFSRALVNAPRDWYKRNMQVVLSTQVLSETGGPPTVVAVHFW